ncbi:rhodanese-like domain-containing protein [Agromyces mangrovi Wang et al. 2018]|uniref:rhodanese-like domain-containing protein n=1 Tax=Agromyces mangrovi TaxID=1858653 RepID=UPI0033065687
MRARGQLAEGRIPGADWVPVEALRARHDEFRGRPVIVHCRVGQGAHTAQRLLAELGHDVRNLDGGYLTWRDGMRARELATAPELAAA